MHSSSGKNKTTFYLGLDSKCGLVFRCVANEALNKRWYIQFIQGVSVRVHYSQMCQLFLAHGTLQTGFQLS